mmetsp:Transcript_34773/g.116205  ORF Transcript_34773/g.116205 Transcript_34773/m.116205 type:complete len:229 (+) Transcript_34773:949-1635(+)
MPSCRREGMRREAASSAPSAGGGGSRRQPDGHLVGVAEATARCGAMAPSRRARSASCSPFHQGCSDRRAIAREPASLAATASTAASAALAAASASSSARSPDSPRRTSSPSPAKPPATPPAWEWGGEAPPPAERVKGSASASSAEADRASWAGGGGAGAGGGGGAAGGGASPPLSPSPGRWATLPTTFAGSSAGPPTASEAVLSVDGTEPNPSLASVRGRKDVSCASQ